MTMDTSTTEGIIQQDGEKSQDKFSDNNFLKSTYNALSSAKNENGTRPKSEESRYVLNELKSDLDELHTLWESALWDARENALWAEKNTTDEGDVKLQSRNVNGKQFVWIENDVRKEANSKPMHQFVADYIANHIGEYYRIIESGQKVYIGEELPNEYTQSEYTKSVFRKNPNVIRAKNKAIGNIGEMIEIANNRRWEKAKHSGNKDAKYGIYRYDTSFGFPTKNNKGEIIGANIYTAELIINNASDGEKISL